MVADMSQRPQQLMRPVLVINIVSAVLQHVSFSVMQQHHWLGAVSYSCVARCHWEVLCCSPTKPCPDQMLESITSNQSRTIR
jgi:hypothetical protein